LSQAGWLPILLRDEYQLGAASWNGTDSVRSRFRLRDRWKVVGV